MKLKLVFSYLSLKFVFFSISLVCLSVDGKNNDKVLSLVTQNSDITSDRFYYDSIDEVSINPSTELASSIEKTSLKAVLITSAFSITKAPQTTFDLSDVNNIQKFVAKSKPFCVNNEVAVDVMWTIKYPENYNNVVFNVSVYKGLKKVKNLIVNYANDKTTYKFPVNLEMYKNYTISLQMLNDRKLIDSKNISFSTYCCVNDLPKLTLNQSSNTSIAVKWTQDICIRSYQLELKNSIPLVDNEIESQVTNDDYEKNNNVIGGTDSMLSLDDNIENHMMNDNAELNNYIDVTNLTFYEFNNLKTFQSYSAILYYTLKHAKENNFGTFYKRKDFTVYSNILENLVVEHEVKCTESLFGENVLWTVSKTANQMKDVLFYVKVYDGNTLVGIDKFKYEKDKFEYNKIFTLEYELRSYTASVEVWVKNDIKEIKNKTFESHCCVKDPPTISTYSENFDRFSVLWYIDRCIENYCLHLINNGPSYERPTYCEPDDRSNKTIDVNNASQYEFTGLKPAYNYATVLHYTAKFGPSGWSNTVNIRTRSKSPDKITNIKHQSYDLSDKFYKFFANVQWKLPCYQNGYISFFKIYYNGVSKLDETNTINKTLNVIPDVHRFEYAVNITEIEPYFEYTVFIEIIIEAQFVTRSDKFKFESPEWKPSYPLIISNSSTSSSLFASWDVPLYPNGKIISYKVTVLNRSPGFCSTNACRASLAYNTTSLNFTVTDLKPYTPYFYKVGAYTKRGYGSESILTDFYTDSDVPDNVINIQHKIELDDCFNDDVTCIAKIAFESPRNMNGPFNFINISYIGTRSNFQNHSGHTSYDPPLLNVYEFDLQMKPEYNYLLNITTINNKFENSTSYNLIAPPAYPKSIDVRNINSTLHRTDNLMIQFELRKDAIDNSNGDIKYIAIYVASKEFKGMRGRWNGTFDTWPKYTLKDRKYSCSLGHTNPIYRITKKMWYPFTNVDKVTVTIGDDAGCDKCDDYCNDQLSENTNYYLIIRLFTNSTYSDSESIPFTSGAIDRIGLMLGCIFGGLCLVAIGLGSVFIWRRKYHIQWFRRKSSAVVSFIKEDPHCIPIKKFASFYKSIKENRDTFTDFVDLRLESERINFDQTFALLPENKRKNRYTNILPFDYNRVKLKIDEDDEIGSDYVNASYIKGVSNENEYIATQGPLFDTVKDFWKMIVQENVGVIAMVANFIENDQKRCHKYIPNNHETMKISKDFEVKCCSELHFGSYCIRSLTIKIGSKIHYVTHMQYLDWPDFGVPNDSESILHFCGTLRERHNVQGGLIVVHCSAGVGRTGTLLAIDILMQRIKATDGINVFDTVLELRKQRKNMVQTEAQYIFIHKCIKDVLENPLNQSTYKLKPGNILRK